MKHATPTDLQRFGLDEKQADTYYFLLENGTSSVSEISARTTNKKGTTYNILTSLVELGLVEMSQSKPKALFRVTDPGHFRSLLQKQQLQAQENAALLETLIPVLTSTYTTTTNAPSVRTYEGIEGIKQIYRAILRAKPKEQLTITSSTGFMQRNEETHQYLREVRRERAKLKIRNRIIGPELPNTRKHYLGSNKELLIERRIVREQFLQNDAEIQIWDNCIALTPMREPQVVTIIENTPIAQTLRNMFEYMWVCSESEHNEIVENWKN